MKKAAIFKIGCNFILHKANEIEKEAVRGGWKPLNTFFVLFWSGKSLSGESVKSVFLSNFPKKFSVRVFT